MDATGTHQPTIATDVPFVGFDWSIVSPRDAGTGQATGKRQHKPLVITMPVDRSSILLMQAIFTNETLPSVQLTFAPGIGSPYMTVELTNAAVSTVHQFTEGGVEYDDVSFTYQTIQFTWLDGTVTTEDDWSAPIS